MKGQALISITPIGKEANSWFMSFFPLVNLIPDIKVEIDEFFLFLNKKKWKNEDLKNYFKKSVKLSEFTCVLWKHISIAPGGLMG